MTTPDYTDADVVVPLLKAVKTDDEWNTICQEVKKVNDGPGGYPSWWYEKVIAANLAAGAGLDGDIKITGGPR
jgi:hypothetical protein